MGDLSLAECQTLDQLGDSVTVYVSDLWADTEDAEDWIMDFWGFGKISVLLYN